MTTLKEVQKELERLELEALIVKRLYTAQEFEKSKPKLEIVLSLLDKILKLRNQELSLVCWYNEPKFNHSTKTPYIETRVYVHGAPELDEEIKLILDMYPFQDINPFNLEISVICKITESSKDINMSFYVDDHY